MDLCSLLCLSWWQTLLLLYVIYLIYMSWHFPLFYRQGIPVPITPIPVLGTIVGAISKGIIAYRSQIVGKFGKNTGSFLGRIPCLTTIDFDIIREVFIKDNSSFPHGTTFNTGDPMNDLMINNVEDYTHWKYLRSTMSPTFSSGKIKRMMDQINKYSSIFARQLQKQDGQAIDIKEYSGSFTMDVVASTAFGLDINTAEDHNSPFVMHAKKAFEFSIGNSMVLVSLFLPFLMPIIRLFKPSLLDKDAIKYFRDVAIEALDARKDDNDRVDFLQLMKNAHKEVEGDVAVRSMTRDEILAQSILFFLAGYDTTASAISFLAYNLALHQEKQDILLEEIDQVFGDKQDVTYEDLHKMPYLEQCINESLRLYPPTIQTDRIASKDVVIQGIKLPKGASILVPIYHLHRLPELFPDPDEFKPERFSTENKASRDPLCFMPFGVGPRMCIAMRLALLEVKVAIIHILKTHRFVRAPETEVPLTFKNTALLSAKNGIWMKVVPREHPE